MMNRNDGILQININMAYISISSSLLSPPSSLVTLMAMKFMPAITAVITKKAAAFNTLSPLHGSANNTLCCIWFTDAGFNLGLSAG